jgi:predicted NBD/HSP70 family sugar kinase
MKKHAYFIGIDNGGSAIKAAVFDENGRELSVSQIQIPAGQNGILFLSGEAIARSYVMLSERRRFVPRTLKAFQSAGMAEVLDS